MRRAYMATQNLYHINIEVKIPLVKVLKVLRKLFQKFPKQGLGQSPKVCFSSFFMGESRNVQKRAV